MHSKEIDTFLKFGYFLDYKNPKYTFDFSQVNNGLYKDLSLDELIELGSSIFINAIQSKFIREKKHVVPLSGGLDSRAVLGALLEFTDASNIYTYTFGTPGTLDFEIGRKIASEIGTNHSTYPLTEYKYDMIELLDISKRVDYQTVLFHHPPVWHLDQKYQDYFFWSGYFGDPLVGSHYNSIYSENIDDAIDLFIMKNEFQREIKIGIDNNYPKKYIKENSNIRNGHISTFELLDFQHRQLKFVAPHVLMNGYKYVTPFLDNNMINFFLSVDNKYRENQLLYKKLLLRLFPRLFSYPVKNYNGLPLNASKLSILSMRVKNRIKRKFTGTNQSINYLDFNSKIREKLDLKEIIQTNIHDLKKRKILDFDVTSIFYDHLEKKANYGNVLILLASLEIHFKSKEINR